MDGLFEYVGGMGTLTTKSFRGYVRQQLKTERHKRHKEFIKRGANSKKPPPAGIEPEQYRRLVDYWLSPDGLADSEKGKERRRGLEDVSHVGRGGYEAAEARMVSLATLQLNT